MRTKAQDLRPKDWLSLGCCLCRTASVLVLLCIPSPMMADDQAEEPTLCDKLASDPDDYDRVADPLDNSEVDAARAVEVCMEAIDADPDNQRLAHLLARAQLLNGEDDTGLRRLVAAAEGGYAASQAELGILHYHGVRGVTDRDHSASAQWFEMAAQNEHPIAQYILGNMYIHGEGVWPDAETGFYWIKEAEKQGHPNAIFKIGTFYIEGFQVPRNELEAVKYFRRAADLGHALSWVALATYILDETSNAEARKEVIDWLCELGIAERNPVHEEYGIELKCDG